VTAANTEANPPSPILRGALTAIITPFDADGAVDVAALKRVVHWQIEQGINGLVPCGTTGEGATLTDDEHRMVIDTVVQTTANRVPVVAGCGSNDTRKTVAAAKRCEQVGADALLVVTPYYNKPNRSGMLAHFEAVARATDLPVVIYNVPSRTGQNLGADLILELAQIRGMIAVKEASGDLDQIAAVIQGRPESFYVLSGDDPLALPTVALGADGVISVVANEAPAAMAGLMAAALEGDLREARRSHFRLLPLMRANFVETNPVPVKTAMELLGWCSGVLRPPLGGPTEKTRQALRTALAAAGLVEDDR